MVVGGIMRLITPTGGELKRAFRCEVHDQISEFKKKQGFPGCEVHHEPHFHELIRKFMSEYKLSEEDIRLVKNGRFVYFENRLIARLWREFHDDNAVLIAVTPDEHRRLHKFGLNKKKSKPDVLNLKKYKWNFLKKFLVYYSTIVADC